MSTDNLYFILVEPQMGENIGAVARAISNFGFYNLRIVKPRDGWPNLKANSTAAHGKFVIEKAQIFEDLKSAISDLNLVIATTAANRDMNKRVINLPEIKEAVTRARYTKIGVLFGRESTGLNNQELIIADWVVNIHTSIINPSLNIAQAACLIAYELSQVKPTQVLTINQSASKQELQLMLDHITNKLEEADYFKVSEKKAGMLQNIYNIFTRADLTSSEVRTLHGIIKALTGSKKWLL